MENLFPRGAEWRKWDLHVHTPESGLANQFSDWDEYVKVLFSTAIKQEVAVLGITDYFSIDGYKKIVNDYLSNNDKLKELFETDEYVDQVKKIRLFPNIEFRLKTIINSSRVNYHVIFSDEVSISDIEENFLHDIEFVYDCDPFEPKNCSKLKKSNLIELGKKVKAEQGSFSGSDYEVGCITAAVNDSQIIDILTTKREKFKDKYIIAIPVDEDLSHINWGSQDHNVRKAYLQQANIFFATNKNTIEFARGKKHDSIQEYIKEFKSIKPCISGCDAHSCDQIEHWLGQQINANHRGKDEKDDVQKRVTWIKADPTFRGLRQVLNEPEDRVFIGEQPEIIEKVETHRTKYIKNISINQLPGYDETQGIWFNNISIPINSELVAIIGNKGSGKSAITDIISLCSNYYNDNEFSFLTSNKFRIKKGKIAQNFKAQLTWEDGKSYEKKLSENIDDAAIGSIKYIPQGQFERLTNEIDTAENFQKEIENVVFSHMPDAERLGAKEFKDLVDITTLSVNSSIRSLNADIETINAKIIELEKKSTKSYIEEIENLYKKKQNELHALIEPIPITNPDEDPEKKAQNDAANSVISKINDEVNYIESQMQKGEIDKKNLITALQQLKNTKEEIAQKEFEIKKFINEKQILMQNYSIDVNTLISVKTDFSKISDVISAKENELESVKRVLGESDNIDVNNKSLPQILEEKRSALKEERAKLNVEQQLYQDYLSQVEKWNKSKLLITGEPETPDTLKYYEYQLSYLRGEIRQELDAKYQERREYVGKIFDEKQKIVFVYEKARDRLNAIIEKNSETLQEYKIGIEASLVKKNDFDSNFLDAINKNILGTYYSKEGGEKNIKQITEEINFNNREEVISFLDNLVDSLIYDKRDNSKTKPRREVNKQVKDIKSLYLYLFTLQFLDINYKLMQGDKELQQLSPGERGALLLVFYLLLDNDTTPLIIDQPEDNLDNHSIATVLVPFIRDAKKKRQIIMVTHNPNLAIVADAEQIIYVKLEKKKNYTFTAISGSIENHEINKKVVEVLEGAMPAFNMRRDKYYGDSNG